MTKTNTKTIVRTAPLAISKALSGVIAAVQDGEKSLVAFGIAMNESLAMPWFLKSNTSHEKVSAERERWDAGFKAAQDASRTPSIASLLEQRRRPYWKRARAYAAAAWIEQGKPLNPVERAEADKMLAVKKTGKPNAPRGYKARLVEELSALYKFHMAAVEFDGVDAAKLGTAIETALKLVGVKPESLTAE